MGLKCSVLGHTYGDATVERDREEQGSEVVITIREIETCDRCGRERIVSENKEVTSIATPDEPDDTGASGASEPDGTDGASRPADDAGTATADDVGTAVDDSTVGDGADGPSRSAVGDDSPPVDGNEGAEILDAESDAPVTDDELADPSIDAGLGSDPVESGGEDIEEDAVIVDDGSDDGGDDGPRQHGEWPEEPAADDEPDWKPTEAVDDETITAPDQGTERNSAVTVPDGQFRCPECGFTTAVESSSLRAGDFCPDCHKGSLLHEAGDGTRKG